MPSMEMNLSVLMLIAPAKQVSSLAPLAGRGLG